MVVRIRSLLTSGPLVVPLSSGASVRLSPGSATDALADVEVANNAKVDKLRDRRLIEVVADDASGPTPEEAPEPMNEDESATTEEPAAETRPAKAPRAGARARQR